MMPAVKHFDPILGVDVHIIQPPGPVPPLPIPHPFVGFVIDPFDYVPIVGATVLVNSMPRGQAGTAGKCVPPHIPIGGVFVKPPANEAEIFMGSATVAVDGDAFSFMAVPALSCHCVGMPPPPRPKKKSKTKSLVLPTSVVLPIPAGPPVLVGGPPTISIMALGMKVGMAGLGKAFKKLSKLKAVKKLKRKAKSLKKKFKDKLKKKKKGKPASNRGSCEGGCPVDAITGNVVDRLLDYRQPGSIPFVWKRYYDSSWAAQDSIVGRGWRHAYQRTLEITDDGFLLTEDNGEEFELPPIDELSGSTVWAGYALSKTTARAYRLQRRGTPDMVFSFLAPDRPAVLTQLRQGPDLANLRYDGGGRLTRIEFSDGRRVAMSYDAHEHLVDIDVHPGDGDRLCAARYEYDSIGNLVRHTDALHNTTRYDYDAASRLTCHRDPLGYGIHYAYDEKGRCIRTWGQDGLYDEAFEYQPELNQSIRRSSTGAQWVYVYDENMTAFEIIDPYGNSRKFIQDEIGRVIADIDEIGQETRLLYDEWGGHYARETPLGDLQPPRHIDMHPPERPLLRLPPTPLEWQWGDLLRPDQIKPPADKDAEPSVSPREVRDAMGRVLEKEDGRGRKERWSYDANGNVIEYVDADGSVFRTEISSWNLPIRKFDPNWSIYQFEYNIHEFITKIVDPGGSISEYIYDLKDRIAEVRRHGVTREHYVWDGAGNLIEKRDGKGKPLLELDIGPGGFPVKRKLASGQTHEFEYDDRGYVTRAATDTSETVFERDSTGRAVSDVRDGLGVRHHVLDSRITRSMIFDRFPTFYDHSESDHLKITDPSGALHRLKISRGGVINKELTNGTAEWNTYDADGHITERFISRSNGESNKTRWNYSPAGDLLEKIDDVRGATHWRYDASHRLLAEITPDNRELAYRRDMAGNLLAKPGLTSVKYSEGNRIDVADGEAYAYNQRNHVSGKAKNGRETSFEYDSKDMLVGAFFQNHAWKAEYDPLGRRLRKTFKDRTTEYYWDDNRLIAEVNHDGSCRIYIYADLGALVPFMFIDYDAFDADSHSGRSYFLFTDQRGCPEWVEDYSGHTVWRADVDPYGAAAIDPGSTIELNLRMPGHYHDPETDLHYNRFRYYDPGLGRYLQSDPIGQSGGYNLYAYCQNPLTQVDIVGWSENHSSDTGGSTRTADAESPAAKGDAPPKAKQSDAELDKIADDVGMERETLDNLSKRSQATNETIIVRGSNPDSLKYHGKPGHTPKPVDVKLKTAKAPDPDAGLVKKPENPTDDDLKNIADLEKKGYSFDDDGCLKTPEGDRVYGDHDLQGSYVDDPFAGTKHKVNTNDPEYQKGLNEDVCPDGDDMFQHGANDNFKKPDPDNPGQEVMGRQPDKNEKYVVTEPDGSVSQMDNTAELEQYYKDNNMDWPYDS